MFELLKVINVFILNIKAPVCQRYWGIDSACDGVQGHAIETLKIGSHHNILSEQSKEMCFVDKVGVVKKLTDQGTTNLYKTIFGVKVR